MPLNVSQTDTEKVSKSTEKYIDKIFQNISENTPKRRKVQSKIPTSADRPVSQSLKEKIYEQILQLIVEDYHLFNIVDSKEFKKLLVLLNPNYVAPSRKLIWKFTE